MKHPFPPLLLAVDFARRQALSCVFPGFIFLMLFLTRRLPWLPLPRYDMLLLLCVGMQWAMWRMTWETTDEVKVICLFHVIGLGLELYKVHLGAWRYPESAWTKIAGVPLYSGFMYASVASYICQAWRRFGLTLTGWPALRRTGLFAAGVYVNFFTERFLPDARWLLALLACLILVPARVGFTVRERRFEMPLLLAFALIGLGVWMAENIATYFGAWQYPNQRVVWHPVGAAKIVSWDLLVTVSFVIVAQLKHFKEGAQKEGMGKEGMEKKFKEGGAGAANIPLPASAGGGG